jgi:hypothetical protein
VAHTRTCTRTVADDRTRVHSACACQAENLVSYIAQVRAGWKAKVLEEPEQAKLPQDKDSAAWAEGALKPNAAEMTQVRPGCFLPYLSVFRHRSLLAAGD